MKVVVLGGTGQIGQAASRLLVRSREVSELIVAARDLGRAQTFANELGAKAIGVRADIDNPPSLDGLLDGAHLVVNTTGPYDRTLLPVLEAAVRNAAHYCDVSEEWDAAEQALKWDATAREAGVTAIIGIGAAPGLTNLLGLHAAAQLDDVSALDVGWYADIELFGSVAEHLADIRDGRVSGTMQALLQALVGPVYGIRRGVKARIDEQDIGKSVPLPDGSKVIGLPHLSSEPLTLHRILATVPNITSRMGLLPESVHELLWGQATKIANNVADPRSAVIELYEALAADPDRWLGSGRDLAFTGLFAVASGTKGGEQVQVSIAPGPAFDVPGTGIEQFGTGGPLALAALKILSDEIPALGIHTPETAFEPDAFLGDLCRRWCKWDGSTPLFSEHLGGV